MRRNQKLMEGFACPQGLDLSIVLNITQSMENLSIKGFLLHNFPNVI